MKGIWEQNTSRFATGSLYKVGSKRTTVGATGRAIGNKSEPDAPLWLSECRLPGIKQAEIRFHTEDEAKADVERRVTAWFGWMKE